VAGFCLSAIATLEFSSQPIRLTHVPLPVVGCEGNNFDCWRSWVGFAVSPTARGVRHPYRQRQFQLLKKSATDQNTEEVPTDQAIADWQYWVAQGYLF
jgi:hypothetical protein